MAHDEYEHQRRQTVALERIAKLLEALVTAFDLREQWEEQEAERRAQQERLEAMQDSVNRTFERIEVARQTGMVPPRPCCHAAGPNHHPACTTNRTEQQ